ncbi:hypothetical protein EVAR_4596_1 [Eumeta japonica]|uniref:Uncharacterized protein n=1 Tax=Eumeta variegata TaxID=151549 RepID=A0A4C1SW99_EUMVA|nr:hypothetical protein EVAR_4596_1 [Eumeta japonica]
MILLDFFHILQIQSCEPRPDQTYRDGYKSVLPKKDSHIQKAVGQKGTALVAWPQKRDAQGSGPLNLFIEDATSFCNNGTTRDRVRLGCDTVEAERFNYLDWLLHAASFGTSVSASGVGEGLAGHEAS